MPQARVPRSELAGSGQARAGTRPDEQPELAGQPATLASASLTWKSPTVITCAPKAREIASRSPLIPSGMTTSIG